MTASHILLSGDWVTPRYIARLWGRSTRQVRRWCSNSYLSRRGCVVFQSQDGRWWIKLPDTPIQPPSMGRLTRSEMSSIQPSVSLAS